MNETSKESCACGAAPKVVFPCSGAADVGAVADQAARRLTRKGTGRMSCLAGVGGRVGGIMETTRAASMVLAIDGCPLECARRTLEEAGFQGFKHLKLAEIGMKKGNTPPTDQNIETVVNAAAPLLNC